jgi:DNA-binding transcriptional LysR family regulator
MLSTMINPKMRGITFDQLRTFSEVIEQASFTAAGDHLGLSQPAVSQQIRLLEKRFGVRLIERVGRKARPTSAGAILLSYARMILDAMASAETEMAPYVKGTMGKVRIGAGATVSIYFLPAVLRMLRRRFDGLEIFVTTGTVSDVLRQIEDNALDLGLVTLPAAGRMFDVSPLLEDEFVVLSSPEGPVLPRVVTAEVLSRLSVLSYEPGAQMRRIIDDWFTAAGHSVRPTMELGSVEAIKEVARAGLGVGIVPRMAVGQKSQGLRIQGMTPPLNRQVGIVVRRDKPLHRGLRETIAVIRQAAPRFSKALRS